MGRNACHEGNRDSPTMNLFFDESGNFQIPNAAGTHAVGIVSGVVIPESQQAEIFSQFDAFLSTLPANAFKNGEPKGRLLDEESLRRFADFLFDLRRGILFCPTMLDITSLIGRPEAEASAAVSKKLFDLESACKHETLKRQIRELAAQVGRMSNQQILRLMTWAICINRCISDSIVFHSSPEFNSSWESMRFELDPVEQSPGNEEKSLRFLLPSWVTSWSVANPMATIEEIHTAEQPFVKAWCTDQGIDVGKMFKGNIHYTSSEESKGIQLADITATVVRKAVIGLATSANLQNYGFLMTKSVGNPLHACGLTFLVPPNKADAERRYAGIVDAINGARRGCANSYSMPDAGFHL